MKKERQMERHPDTLEKAGDRMTVLGVEERQKRTGEDLNERENFHEKGR